MRQIRAILSFAAVLAIIFVATSGGFLVVNEPSKADVAVVLAGETDARPRLGLEMLRRGYVQRLILDVPAAEKVYSWPETELAEKYVKSLPEAPAVSVCPVYGLSTKAEAQDVAGCLREVPAKTVLVVTSDYHTRRAVTIFRHELPQYRFSVVGASTPDFGEHWWTRRQWAKINFDEWVRLAWWTVVDRWH